MAKLRNSFSSIKAQKPPSLSSGVTTATRSTGYRDDTVRRIGINSSSLSTKGINFGVPHTKTSIAPSGSSWSSLLKSATSGGSSVLSDGLLSVSGIGLIGKLFGLFGGGSSTPAAPTQFQSPVPQQTSLTIGKPDAAGSVSLGVHALSSNASSGVYQQTGVLASTQTPHSAQVVQIVKQALLTSSSLNDVISEI